MKNIQDIHNKVILLQTTYQPTPHLETELEIMEQLLEQGNKIYWIICDGDFRICFHNPEHILQECKNCYYRVSNGFKLLKDKILNHKNITILKYDKFLKTNEFENSKPLVDFNFLTIQELKKFHYKTYDVGLATFSSLVSYTRNHEPIISDHQSFIEKALFTGAYLYETFQLILNKIKPDLIILFNGRFIENRPLLRVAQERKIDYATHERGGKLNSFLFRINSIPHSLDTISQEIESLWENAIDDKIEIGKTFYTNRIKKVEDAWYSFTKEQQDGKLPESLKNNDKKVITIFNSSLDEYEGLEGFGPFFYDNDNEGIKAICESLKVFPEIKLYLRVHPNLKGIDNSQNRFLKMMGEMYDSIEVIEAQDKVDTYSLINASDLIVVFGSTVGVEAAFAGKNVVLLGHASYQNLNCLVIPKNHEELIEMLTNNHYEFPNIKHEDTLKYGYWNERFGFPYKHYQPINIADGTYRGVKIELKESQKRRIKFLLKLNRKKKKYLGFLFKTQK
jgi:hypothetical protein